MKLVYKLLLGACVFTLDLVAQDVYIPDANFKSYLIGNTAINTNGDLEIQESEANVFTGEIECSGLSISDLTGIESFTFLTGLKCENNQLLSLDINSNVYLTQLRCGNNNLVSLDVSENIELTHLSCYGNQLSMLDVTSNSLLAYFDCSSNYLSTLNVGLNPALQVLSCAANQLTDLNVGLNTSLTLLTAQVNQLTSLDVSLNPLLAYLDCSDNSLSSIDVSSNPALEYLFCDYNQISALDVSSNPVLVNFGCSFNQLTALDLSLNNALNALFCNDNQLSSLNLANGNNQAIFQIYAHNNSDLSCVQIDDVAYGELNWMDDNSLDYLFDSIVEFSLSCNSSASVDEMEPSIIVVSPIPVNDVVTISNAIDGSIIKLVDLAGKTLLVTKVTTSELQLNLEEFNSGIFLVQVIVDGQVIGSERIVKQ